MLLSTYQTKVRFNQAIHGRHIGQVQKIKTDKNGIILDRQVRRRLADNDGSVEIVSEKKSSTSNENKNGSNVYPLTNTKNKKDSKKDSKKENKNQGDKE